jgi:hypothetical protein
MMADNKEQRVCVKFYFLLGKSAAETVLMLQEAFKEEAFSKTQVYERYPCFKWGEISCEDQPRSGRTSTCRNDENLEKVRNAINAHRRRTIDEISEIKGLSWSSCMSANVNGRFEYETCFPKIRSSVVHTGSKKIV